MGSSRRRVWAGLAGVAVLVLALGFSARSGWAPAPASSAAPVAIGGEASTGASPASVAHGAPEPAPPAALLQLDLLPDAGVAADTRGVRVGLARLSREARQRHLDWLQGGARGAGPAELMDLAEVEQWIEPEARLRPDGRVRLGPTPLPKADLYVLEARGVDGLRYYRARFAAAAIPRELAPVAAAGLRLRLELGGQAETRVRLQRLQPPADPALWQRLLATEAPQLAAAFDESGLAFREALTLAPLPPAPLQAVLLVDGVEAERRAVSLVPGQFTTLRFDAGAAEAAQALSASLRLQLVEHGSNAPIEGVQVRWQAPHGERVAVSDDAGRVHFRGLDRFSPQRFDLQFPVAQAGGLPRWPERRTLELLLDALPPDQGEPQRFSHRIEVQALQWLVLAGEGRRAGPPVRGQPYPVYVLQQADGERWRDAAAEQFLPVAAGLAVSIEGPGRYRAAVAESPWTIHYSGDANFDPSSAAASRIVDLRRGKGESRRWRLVDRAGRALALHPVQITGLLRGLPPLSLSTDAQAQLSLDEVTVERLHIEPQGHAGREIDVAAAESSLVFGADE